MRIIKGIICDALKKGENLTEAGKIVTDEIGKKEGGSYLCIFYKNNYGAGGCYDCRIKSLALQFTRDDIDYEIFVAKICHGNCKANNCIR